MGLADLCEMYQPQTITKSEMSPDGAYPVFGANGIMGRYHQYNHSEPQLLIGCRGACGTVHLTTEAAWITGNSMVVRPRTNNALLAYLRYFFLGPAKLERTITGAAQPQITQGSLRAVNVPLPPLEEQQQIVAVLDEAFEGLARARANAEANLRDAREMFASYLGNFFGSNDEDWVRFSVGQLVAQEVLYKPQDGNHGEIHPKKADFVEDGVPFIMASDLKGGGVDQVGCNHLTRVQADVLRTGFAKNGDVLLSHKGTIGRTAILETEQEYVMLTPQVTYYRVRDTSRLLPEFLFFAFQSATFQHDLITAAQDGATRAYIGITRQLDLRLSVPSIETQRELVSLFQDMQEKTPVLVDAYQRQLSDIATLRQSLLQKAFEGELT